MEASLERSRLGLFAMLEPRDLVAPGIEARGVAHVLGREQADILIAHVRRHPLPETIYFSDARREYVFGGLEARPINFGGLIDVLNQYGLSINHVPGSDEWVIIILQPEERAGALLVRYVAAPNRHAVLNQ